ncbi:MAG: hypothetical protein RL385_148 [Pseudomonadota bacterium]|jgi:hypothetical protein
MVERKLGRDREVDEVVRLKRAAQVGRLLLGELNGAMEEISPERFSALPRSELQRQLVSCRRGLRGEIEKFCKKNFENLGPEGLASLYVPLREHGSSLRMPLVQFIAHYGQPRPGVLGGAPIHSTVHLSPWGLQTEYPELRLTQDLAEAYNVAAETHAELETMTSMSWDKAKSEIERNKIGRLLRRRAFHQRMALIACFNLVEAYINGLAWAYVHHVGAAALSETQRGLLMEDKRPVNTIDKLVKIPRIIGHRDEGPLHQSREPLKSFLEIVKPFRDAVVHASPFDAPEKFGGYNKLTKLYEMDQKAVDIAVSTTLAMIAAIHAFLDGNGKLPSWIPDRDASGRFQVDALKRPP